MPVPEVVEHAVAMGLYHFCVDIEAGVAQLSDLLRQQLNTVHRVAKDDRLVNLKLRGHGYRVSAHKSRGSKYNKPYLPKHDLYYLLRPTPSLSVTQGLSPSFLLYNKSRYAAHRTHTTIGT